MLHVWNKEVTCYDVKDVEGMYKDVLVKCIHCSKYRLALGTTPETVDYLRDLEECSARKAT